MRLEPEISSAILKMTSTITLNAEPSPPAQVLSEASRTCFVPLCVGGGIKDMSDANGVKSSALQVADAYFRAGADKVSLGSDAVEAARAYYARGGKGDGTSSIETISAKYGAQVCGEQHHATTWLCHRSALHITIRL